MRLFPFFAIPLLAACAPDETQPLPFSPWTIVVLVAAAVLVSATIYVALSQDDDPPNEDK